jgi:hypothetical protein
VQDEVGPDPWDKRYNPEFILYDEPIEKTRLPDREVFKDSAQRVSQRPPPVFAVEVTELPRQAGIEWHAHVGLSSVEPNTVQMAWYSDVSATASGVTAQVQHTLVKTGEENNFIHSVVALSAADEPSAALLRQVWLASMERTDVTSGVLEEIALSPYMVYVDSNHQMALDGREWPAVPCKSIWSEAGLRLGAVALFRTTRS